MFHQPGYIENVSLRLSGVLDDIGVNERIVIKRRRTWLLIESMQTVSLRLLDSPDSSYFLGSQSEGSTTIGLVSDLDNLVCVGGFNVIQDWRDWKPGLRNLLMIQDETVSPGYCLLQCLRGDAPLPCTDVFNKYQYSEKTGRVLLRNTIISSSAGSIYKGAERHGPAFTKHGKSGFTDVDNVDAYLCKSWPLQARQLYGAGQWPSCEMQRYCSNTGCFVVGVGSKGSENEDLEWRVSTALAERCLMFNLNITQIRCYVLMKMILKSFFKQPHIEETISSFMCKTVLLHCIANTHSNIWRETNLLACLSLSLYLLCNSILSGNCPHFFIPGNNLIRGKISPALKPYILNILRYIINSEGTALLAIECDALGSRLELKFNGLYSFKLHGIVSGQIIKTSALFTEFVRKSCLPPLRNSSHEDASRILKKYITDLVIISNKSQEVDKPACNLLATWFCTTLGSVLASLNIQQDRGLSAEALGWISLGLNTDVSSSKLKLASMFYCIGDFQKTDIVLKDIEGNYDLNIVESICFCHEYIHQHTRREFNAISNNQNEDAIQYITAFCVKFLPCEMNCIPKELQYEMFRSTQEDRAFRSQDDDWMDWAVVDSLPYFYFLQYKLYSNLERQADRQKALCNLVRTIYREPNLGHRETALNLLGQCMEQEQRPMDALHCYLISLNRRERNNAAKFHICMLLSNMINNQ